MADSLTTGESVAPGTPETPPANTTPPATSGATPPATPPATNEGDESITLTKKDYNNLISQRDKATNAARSSEGQQAFLESLAQEKSVKDFLNENKDSYPDLNPEDLSHVWDPDQLKDEADRIQRRLQDHAQAKIMSVEQSTAPVLSPVERAEKLKQLKESGDPNAFEKMLNLRLAA
jgi:hypothetical protein